MIEYIKQFKNLLEENQKNEIKKSFINGKELKSVNQIYLALFAEKNSLSGNYISIDEIKKNEIGVKSGKNPLIFYETNFNKEIVIFKKDIFKEIPFFEQGKEDLKKIEKLLKERKISGFSINTFEFDKFNEEVDVYPISNISYFKKEVFPVEYIQKHIEIPQIFEKIDVSFLKNKNNEEKNLLRWVTNIYKENQNKEDIINQEEIIWKKNIM